MIASAPSAMAPRLPRVHREYAGMLLAGQNSVIAWICIGVFSLAAFGWGYALWLKLRVVSTPE